MTRPRSAPAHGTVLEIMSRGTHLEMSSVIFMDPPAHTQLRALVSRAFTPRRVAQLEVRVREICADLFAEVEGRSSFDFVQDFAARLPSEVISSLLGIPESDRAFARHHIDQMFHIEPGVGMINETLVQRADRSLRLLG